MKITQNIELDVAIQKLNVQVDAKQGDDGCRFVRIALLKEGAAYTPPSGAAAQFRCLKPDGCSCMNPAVINSDGSVTVELTDQVLAVPGAVLADVLLVGSDGERLSSVSFVIRVRPAPLGNDIQSTSEMLVLQELIDQSGELINQMEGLREDAAESARQAAAAVAQGLAEAKASGEFDGVGVKSVKQTTTSTADGGTNVVTVTLDNGTTSKFNVKNGSKGSTGATGAAGYTPIRGTDYWTEADIAEMEGYADDAIAALGLKCTAPGISWDTTYISQSSTSIYVRKYGKVVVVRPYVKMNSAATATDTRFQIATGLPVPLAAWYGTMTEVNGSLAHTLVVSTDGTMGIQVGSTNAITSKLLRGCITYLTNE